MREILAKRCLIFVDYMLVSEKYVEDTVLHTVIKPLLFFFTQLLSATGLSQDRSKNEYG